MQANFDYTIIVIIFSIFLLFGFSITLLFSFMDRSLDLLDKLRRILREAGIDAAHVRREWHWINQTDMAIVHRIEQSTLDGASDRQIARAKIEAHRLTLLNPPPERKEKTSTLQIIDGLTRQAVTLAETERDL